jgi:hypothetical protein
MRGEENMWEGVIGGLASLIFAQDVPPHPRAETVLAQFRHLCPKPHHSLFLLPHPSNSPKNSCELGTKSVSLQP